MHTVQKKIAKKESMCRFQSYLFFFLLTDFCFSNENEGAFSSIFQKKKNMSFAPFLP